MRKTGYFSFFFSLVVPFQLRLSKTVHAYANEVLHVRMLFICQFLHKTAEYANAK
jgi:hypothetical protein